jgi:hypothetical protein
MNAVELSQKKIGDFIRELTGGKYDPERKSVRVQSMLMVLHDFEKDKAATSKELEDLLFGAVAQPEEVQKKLAAHAREKGLEEAELERRVTAARARIDDATKKEGAGPGEAYKAVPSVGGIMDRLRLIPKNVKDAFIGAQLALRIQVVMHGEPPGFTFPDAKPWPNDSIAVKQASILFNTVNAAHQDKELGPILRNAAQTTEGLWFEIRKQAAVARDQVWQEAATTLNTDELAMASRQLDHHGTRLQMPPFDPRRTCQYTGDYSLVLEAKNDFKSLDQEVRRRRHALTANLHAALTSENEALQRVAGRYLESLGFGAATREQVIEALEGPPEENTNELAWKIFNVAHRKSVYEQKLATAGFRETATSITHREMLERMTQPRSPQTIARFLGRAAEPASINP